MEKNGIAAIGAGWSSGENRVEKAVKNALEGQLLDINDVTKDYSVLVHVSGGEDLTLEEVYRSGKLVTRTIMSATGSSGNKGCAAIVYMVWIWNL